MKITILLNEPYPHGMAATNRIHLYAKRFKEQGHDVEIVVPMPTEIHRTKAVNFQIKGEYDGIKFRYSLSPVRSKSFIMRRINDVFAYFNTWGYLIRTRRNSDVFLVAGIPLYNILTCKFFCLIFNCKFVWEKTELPFVFAKKNTINIIYHKIYARFVFRLFDGIILISDNLYDYFKDKAAKKTRFVVIPILTDTSVFIPTENNSGEIVYAGVLNQFKDGIIDLLKAYRIFIEKMPERKLVLMGDINLSSDKEEINKFIWENNLQDKIELTGYVSRTEMIGRMCNAAVLVLAKPANLQSEYCVPTKIAEYLSTGKPVLTTNTGVIPKFLTNDKDSFLVEPGSPVKFSEALENILADYAQSQIVGKKGRILAQDQFEYTRQGDRILAFFMTC